jgi:hypothetical protein
MSTTLEFDVRLANNTIQHQSVTVTGLSGVTEDGQFGDLTNGPEANAYRNYLGSGTVYSLPAGASVVNDNFVIVENGTRSGSVALGGLLRPAGSAAPIVAGPPADPTQIRAISNTVGISYGADGRAVLWTRASATATEWTPVGPPQPVAAGPTGTPRPDGGAPRPDGGAPRPQPVAAGGNPPPPGGAPARPRHDGNGGAGNGHGGHGGAASPRPPASSGPLRVGGLPVD